MHQPNYSNHLLRYLIRKILIFKSFFYFLTEPCLAECIHGFAHDARGHLLCECAESPSTVITTDCPSATECREYCSSGPNHNTLACGKCKICRANICKPLTDCKKQCTNGFAVNEEGCPICRCLGR